MVSNRRSMLGGMAAIGMALAAGAAPAAEPVVLKYGWMGPATEPTYVRSMAPFGKHLTQQSNGTVKVDMYPGGALGKDPNAQLTDVLEGVLDIAFIIPSYTPGRFPDNELFEMPGIFRDAGEATLVMWRMHEKGMLRGYEGLHVLQLATTYPNLIHTKGAIKGLDDVKGLKLRVSGSIAADTVTALGAVAVGMPVNSAAEGVSRGVLDGTVSDWNTYAAFRLTDVAPVHLGVRMGQAPMLVAMTQARYDSLPQEAKDALGKIAYEKLSREVAAIHDEIATTWQDKVKTLRGHEMINLNEAQTATFETLTKPVVDAWIAKGPKNRALFDAVQTELATIRASR